MNEVTEAELLRQVAIARREVLGVIEAVYGATPQWGFIRSQVLRALGDKGLEGGLQRIIGEHRAHEGTATR